MVTPASGHRLAGGIRGSVVSGLAVGGLLLAWWVVTEFHLFSGFFIPKPAVVWRAFLDVGFSGDGYRGNLLWYHLWVSLQRIGIAFLAGVLTAVPLGLATGMWPRLGSAIDPFVDFYRPVPPLGYYTLLVVWFGIGELSKIMLLYLAALPVLFISTREAVRNVPELLQRAALTLGASRRQVFRHVIFHACLPEVFTGMRVAIGVTYGTVVAAEIVAANAGIGWMVLDASHFLRTDIIFVGVIVMGVTGIGLDYVIRLIDRRVVPWRGKA